MAGGGRIGPVDRFQRRWPVLGVPIAVVYKYVDDQATYLAVIVTYYALFAIFPLLLLATSILGLLLQGNPELQARVLDSALSQFPVIGDQFRRPEGLTGSRTAVVVGSIAAVYGAMGLGTARPERHEHRLGDPAQQPSQPFPGACPRPVDRGFRRAGRAWPHHGSVLVSNTTLIAWFEGSPVRWLARVVSVLVVGGVLFVLMRLAAARPDRQRTTLPGAMLTAVLWHLIQQIGAVYVTHVLAGADAVNQTFGLVLGLMAAIFLVSVAGMLGVELNVVLDRHLWPRALLTPFTDSVRLTDADRRAYRGYAAAQRHKGFETVTVDFDDDPDEE